MNAEEQAIIHEINSVRIDLRDKYKLFANLLLWNFCKCGCGTQKRVF
jgi:hypothetical protein